MDLNTKYLGFDLPHPFVPGASPLTDDLDTVRLLEDADAPMLTLRSLFEEQIVSEQMATYYATHQSQDSFPEAISYLPDPHDVAFGPQEYLEHVRRVCEAVDIPVVASLNGNTLGGWLKYAELIQQAGANALELNLYSLATDPERSGDAIELEAIQIIDQIKARVSIPIAVKLSPFYTSLSAFAKRLDKAGADAIVIFNRFYQPDIDVENLDVEPVLTLSDSSELLLRLRWLAILSGQIEADLAATGGVHTAIDAVKAVMCGAGVTQIVSALLQHGPSHLKTIKFQFETWLQEHDYDSLSQMRGNMSLQRCPNPKTFERANYMKVLESWDGTPGQ